MESGETAPDFPLQNQDGEPVRRLRKVKPAEHDDRVLGELAA